MDRRDDDLLHRQISRGAAQRRPFDQNLFVAIYLAFDCGFTVVRGRLVDSDHHPRENGGLLGYPPGRGHDGVGVLVGTCTTYEH